MYAKHNPVIAAAMRNNLAAFTRGVIFTICSMRQPFPSVPDQLEQVDAGDLSPLFGHKLDAHKFVLENAPTLKQSIIAAPDNAKRLEIICGVPGIGLVKGGFILQLMGYDVACLDTRNIQREGRNPRAFRSDGEKKKHGPAWQRKIVRYLRETEGRSQFYWDAWCEHMSGIYDLPAEEISAMPLAIVPNNYVPF